MVSTQYIVDMGLFDLFDANKIGLPKSTFDEVNNQFETIRQYREFAHPGFSSWTDYIYDVFSILGITNITVINSKLLSEGVVIDGDKNKYLVIYQNECNIHNLVENLFFLESNQRTNEVNLPKVVFCSNGFVIDILNISIPNEILSIFHCNLENIIIDKRVDSFLVLIKALNLVSSNSNNSVPKDVLSGDLATIPLIKDSTNKNIQFPTLSMLYYYVNNFTNLNINFNRNYWNEGTYNCAPHKPILLLSILDTFELSENLENKFVLSPELIDCYSLYWSLVYPKLKINSNYVYPFFHLTHDRFWKLIPHLGREDELLEKKEIDSLKMMNSLIQGARFIEELYYLLLNKNFRDFLKINIIQKYFEEKLQIKLYKVTNVDNKEITIFQRIKDEMLKNIDIAGRSMSGYIELPFHPNVPLQDYPTKKDCLGFDYISINQLCNLAQKNSWSRSSACYAFGGDNGYNPVIPERQPRINRLYRIWKFVLISAVEDYFIETRINWV